MGLNKLFVCAIIAAVFTLVNATIPSTATTSLDPETSSILKLKEAQILYINKKLLLENAVIMKIHEIGTNVGMMEAKIEDIILKSTAPMKKILDSPTEINKNYAMCLDQYKINEITMKIKADTRACINEIITEVRGNFNTTMKELKDRRENLEQEFADNAYNATYMADTKRGALLEGIKLMDAALPKKDVVVEVKMCTKKYLDIFNAEMEKMMIDFKLCTKMAY